MKNYNMKLARAAMTLLLLLVTSTTVWAQTSASYRAYNAGTKTYETRTANSCTAVTAETTTMGTAGNETWYVVSSNVTVSDSRIEVLGTVNLILADDKRMRAEKGLHVPEGVTLNIYGQNYGTGHLYSAPQEDRLAGIGGNSDQTSGIINIHGGSIEAYGNYQSAAIGGGHGANGGTTTIYGGTVNATGGYYGAGIGGGSGGTGGTVNIYGGTVNAQGGAYGAGIGGGAGQNVGNITISGGTVIAQAGNETNYIYEDDSQAIGSGAMNSNSGGMVKTNNMKVYDSEEATEPVAFASCESIFHSKFAKLIPCTAHNYVNDVCTICGGQLDADNPGTYLAYQTATQTFVTQTANNPTFVTGSTTVLGADNTETWYSVTKNITVSDRIEVRGTVHLILCDGKTLTASKGITVNSGNSLTIYGQTAGTGVLNATGVQVGGGGTESAAIGSTGYSTVGDITIHGGKITATGAGWSAGIGGGICSGNGSITIYGGTVNATGNTGAEAIGHGGGNNIPSVSRTLADGLRVTTGSNTTPVAYGDRVSALSQSIVKVEPCTEHYTTTDHCDYCGFACYRVTYDSNNATDGTVPVDNTVYLSGQTVTVLANTGNLVRTGYTFGGWNTQADGRGTTYATGATFTISGTTTLYAKWNPITYTVRFNKNHDDATGTMSDLAMYYGTARPLTANAFTRDGYQFTGWSTTPNGTATYTDGQDVSNLTAEQGAVVNLYAIWTQHIYTITYNLNGGSVATPNPTTYSELNQDITLVNPTKANYDFIGWTGSNGSTPQTTVTIPHGSSGDRTYTANWVAMGRYYLAYNTYTKEFETKTLANNTTLRTVTSGTTSMSNGWYVVGSDVTINSRITVSGTVNLILRDGVTMTALQGITVNRDNSLIIYGQSFGTGALIATGPEGGNHAPIGSTGELSQTTMGSITIHGGHITATSTGWSAGIGGGIRSGGSSITIYGGTINATGHGNGQTSNSEAIGRGTDGANVEKNLADGLRVTTGSNTTPVTSANRVSALSQLVVRVEPCTEHYNTNNRCKYCGLACYHVTYNGNNATGGAVPIDNTVYISGQTVTVLGNTGNLERTGYVFAGWNTQADGLGADYATDATFNLFSPVTLYAKWATRQMELVNNADNSNAINLASGDGIYNDVTLADRTLYRNGDWNTLCLPFDMTISGSVLYGATAKTLSSTSYDSETGMLTLNFGEAASTIEAGKPYIIKWENRTVNLSTLTANYTAQDGETLTGTLGGNYKISIADGATVTLNGVTINGTNNNSYQWAGITCIGDATIILKGSNTVKGFHTYYPGIYVPSGKTLTIKGSGSLTASSNGRGAGIGGGYNIACGNIVIACGNITATGGGWATAIGGGYGKACGNITIKGGTIKATASNNEAGYNYAGGIGSGYKGSCGNITITDGVTSVYSTKGGAAPNNIGAGKEGSCGIVTVAGVVGAITTSPYTYTGTGSGSASVSESGNLVNPVFSNVTISNATANVTTDYVDFVGSYAPFSANGFLFDAHNPSGDAMHVAINAHQEGYYCGTYYTDAAHTDVATSIPFAADGSVIIYPEWVPIDYTISYDLAGGSVATPNPASYTIESNAITLVNPTREGCTFIGWTGTDLTEPTQTVTIPAGSISNRSYTAVWTINDYTIAYDLAGGNVATPNPTSYTVESNAITLVNPAREGYDFAGWTGTDLDEPTMTVTIPAGSTGGRSYTATWTIIVYTITYDLDGGYEPSIPNPDTYTIESGDITLNNPPLRVDIDEENGTTYYQFSGWTGTDLTEPTQTVTIPNGSTGDRTYTATWNETDIPFEGIEVDKDYAKNEVGRYYIKMPYPGDENYLWDEELEEEVRFINGAEETPKIVNIPEWFTTAFKVYDDGGKENCANDNPSESHITTLILNAPEGKVFSVQGVLDIGTWYNEEDWLKVYDGAGTDNEIHCATDGEIDPFVTSSNSIRLDLHIEVAHYPSNMDLTVSVIDPPIVLNLVENSLTPNGATVEWTGPSESYTLQYAEGEPFIDVLSEGFEGGSLPGGWTTNDNSHWAVGSGTGHEDYTSAATGNYNATCYIESSDTEDYLITPFMDLSGVASANLTFNYRNVSWGSDLNELHVYYRVDEGSWNELYSNTSAVSSWKLVTIPLQGLAANYQIGFKCYSHYGYGMGIDDVKIFVDNPALAWTTADNATSPYTFDNLDFETTYSVRVIGTTEGQPDRISNILSFTTLERCPVPTNLNIVENSLSAYGATVNWRGFSGNYNIKLGEVNYLINADFETGDLSQASFTTTGDYPWTVVENSHSGSWCAKSASGNDDKTSALEIQVTLEAARVLTFSAKVSSEDGWDKAYFSIDDNNEIDGISGDGDWMNYSYPLTAGTHTLRWYYTKDGSDNSNDDCFYVDDIRITDESTELGTYISNTTNYTLTGLSAGTTYEVQVQADGGAEGTSQWSAPIMFTTTFDLILANNADNSDAIRMAATNGSEFNVTLANRTLYKDGDWNTLCLPFNLTIAGSPLDGDGVEVRTLSTATFENSKLTLNFTPATGEGAVTELVAGTPYIIKWSKADGYVAYNGSNADVCNDLVNPMFSGITVDATARNQVCDLGDGKSITFVGTYSPVVYNDENKSVLFLGGGSSLYYPDGTETTTINACRGYFTLNGITAGDPQTGGDVKAFVLNFGDGTDNIGEVKSERVNSEKSDDALYDLSGRKIENGRPTQRGIYIHNGRKVTIK